MTQGEQILAALPATSVELAALLGSTVRRMNAHLQWLAAQRRCRNTRRRTVKPDAARRGCAPMLWVRT